MKIVICSGYFDPIHVGHIEYLKLAHELCDVGDKLIVILNNDKQAILKKGKEFMPLKERKIVLKSVRYVDDVFISVDKDLSVCQSIRRIHNSFRDSEIVFAKGGDRFSSEVPESSVCSELGIKIVDGLGKKIQSSSNLTG